LVELPFETGEPRQGCARGVEPRDAARIVDDNQPTADVDRGRRRDAAALEQRQLGRAAADVDVEDARRALVGRPRGPRAVGGEHRLHVVAGGRADELAAELGEELADRLGVLAPQRFAGENHRAGIDVVRMQPGARVGGIDDRADRAFVDAALVEVGRQRNRRLVQRLAVHYEIAALQVLAEAPHVQAREDHLRSRRTDVDADARQRDVVVDPERVRLGRAARELVVVVIVLVVRVLVVTVLAVGAVQMILQRVPGLGQPPGVLARSR